MWEALNNLPSRLDDTYARLIYQIEGQDTHTKELALNTFLWVFHSRRPLSLKILKHALAVDHTHRNPADLNMEGIESIKNACGNLVHEENNTIRPIHRSFYEFIIKNTTQIPESSTIKAIRDAAYANGKLALSCLRCLTSLPGFSNFHGSRIADDIRAHPFRQYAANCFDLHLNEVEEISEEVDRELETLFTDGGLICDVLLRRKISSFSKNTYPGVGSRLRTPNNPQVFLLSTYLYDAPHIYDRFASRFGSAAVKSIHSILQLRVAAFPLLLNSFGMDGLPTRRIPLMRIIRFITRVKGVICQSFPCCLNMMLRLMFRMIITPVLYKYHPF